MRGAPPPPIAPSHVQTPAAMRCASHRCFAHAALELRVSFRRTDTARVKSARTDARAGAAALVSLSAIRAVALSADALRWSGGQPALLSRGRSGCSGPRRSSSRCVSASLTTYPPPPHTHTHAPCPVRRSRSRWRSFGHARAVEQWNGRSRRARLIRAARSRAHAARAVERGAAGARELGSGAWVCAPITHGGCSGRLLGRCDYPWYLASAVPHTTYSMAPIHPAWPVSEGTVSRAARLAPRHAMVSLSGNGPSCRTGQSVRQTDYSRGARAERTRRRRADTSTRTLHSSDRHRMNSPQYPRVPTVPRAPN
jgi:hypothetical protein